MTKGDILLLFEYDRWANNRVLQAAATLTVEQFTRDLGGSFHSVRDTLLHIIGGEWGWLTYWIEPTHNNDFLAKLWDRHDALFRPDVFPNIEAVRLKWAEVEKDQIGFLNHLTDEALRRMFPVRRRTFPARKTELSLAHLMQHLANHSTYHRGQVAVMIRQLGATPVATDFHAFLIEGRGDV